MTALRDTPVWCALCAWYFCFRTPALSCPCKIKHFFCCVKAQRIANQQDTSHLASTTHVHVPVPLSSSLSKSSKIHPLSTSMGLPVSLIIPTRSILSATCWIRLALERDLCLVSPLSFRE
ncbi:uncharacterized [Tachysurus ichikawai]